MGKAVPAPMQDQAVYSYIQQSRLRGVDPEAASAVLLLNLVREVHRTLSDIAGPMAASEVVDRAISRSLVTLPAPLHIV